MMNCVLLNAARARDIQRLITSHVVWYGNAFNSRGGNGRATFDAIYYRDSSRQNRRDDVATARRTRAILRGSNLAIKE
jgi:hypothetical protein